MKPLRDYLPWNLRRAIVLVAYRILRFLRMLD